MVSPRLKPISWSRLAGWEQDEHGEAFAAFRRSAFHAMEKPYKTGSLGLEESAFREAYVEARRTAGLSGNEAKRFFERHFQPAYVTPEADKPRGFMTGYYEPVIAASRTETSTRRVPFLRRPDDLVKVGNADRPADMDPYFAFARSRDGRLEPYPDRRMIERGVLAGRGLEIAWVEDPVDAFFAHVQGCARLKFSDGTETRITYAAKNGFPFTGPGRVLANMGEIPLRQVTMQSIRTWFRENPERVREILWRNRSYIFFREAPVDDPALGPIAAAKVPLTPLRSLAVDKTLHTFSTPVFITVPRFPGGTLNRLVVAQDTGSAIVGAARGDFFTGSGDAAGELAGVIRHAADFHVLVPKPLVTG